MRPPANNRERCISREIRKLELRQARQDEQERARTSPPVNRAATEKRAR